ncbi:hypothetical protein FIBSPDRAFT_964364 [Athelia psychrophila]|uniref:Uncharacterized protein n=1 Tax=Athelia psychrophila TaxID=1759441 RepID=A0A165XUV3_9AGAM|nr:hypothetical protein FIBSPDRAFT_964364 [Fibularhizoctonia sp. CBS 109695]
MSSRARRTFPRNSSRYDPFPRTYRFLDCHDPLQPSPPFAATSECLKPDYCLPTILEEDESILHNLEEAIARKATGGSTNGRSLSTLVIDLAFIVSRSLRIRRVSQSKAGFKLDTIL